MLMKHCILLVLLDVHGVGILLHRCAVESLCRRSRSNLGLSTPCLGSCGSVMRCRGIWVGVG